MFRKACRTLTNYKNVHAPFVNTGVKTMEICPALNTTCLFCKNKSCRADYRISCIEALEMTAMVEAME